MRDLLNVNTIPRKINNQSCVIETDTEKSGWGFFSPELSFFLVDFCKKQLTPIQNIIFYAYYVNGMTMKDIAERLQTTYQAVHAKVGKIENKLRYSWKYLDRWSDDIITQRVKGKKVRIFNPNKKKEK